jgi:hypothetical protein
MPLREYLAVWKYRIAGGHAPSDIDESIRAALEWLGRSQDASGCDGFSRGYGLRGGWQLPYPETTGYIVQTLIALDARYPDLRLSERAWRAGRWLAQIQFDSGAICTKMYRADNRVPSIFNTGMVLHGWVSLLQARDDERIRKAARKAVAWLSEEQEADGSWVRNAYNRTPHTYYTMIDWALARYAALFSNSAARATAVKHLDWTLAQQRSNGWFDSCGFAPSEPVTTHTISYTTQGLVECARILGEARYTQGAVAGTMPLRREFEQTGRIAGTYDADWRPTAAWECCTGNAQTSAVWQALAAVTRDAAWQSAAEMLNAHTLEYQKVGTGSRNLDGAIPGSWPITGGYDGLMFPNHAAKFHIDALSELPATGWKVAAAT